MRLGLKNNAKNLKTLKIRIYNKCITKSKECQRENTDLQILEQFAV